VISGDVLTISNAPRDHFAASCREQPAVERARVHVYDQLQGSDLGWFMEEGIHLLLDSTQGKDEHFLAATLETLAAALKACRPFETVQQVCERTLSYDGLRDIERSMSRASQLSALPPTWSQSLWHLVEALGAALSTFQYAGTGHAPRRPPDYEARARQLAAQASQGKQPRDKISRSLQVFCQYAQLHTPTLRDSVAQVPHDATTVGLTDPLTFPVADARALHPIDTAQLWNRMGAVPGPIKSGLPLDSAAPTAPVAAINDEIQQLLDSAAADEQRARMKADATIDRLIEALPQKVSVPTGAEGLVLGLLTQLSEWPKGHQIHVMNEHGRYLEKYGQEGDFKRAIELVRRSNGEYVRSGDSTEGASDRDQLLKLIFKQLPRTSELGRGGNFPGSDTTEGRIVTVREQLAGCATKHRAPLFDALGILSGQPSTTSSAANRFAPFWTLASTHTPNAVISKLQSIEPGLSKARLDALLVVNPLSTTEHDALLADGSLPDTLGQAMRLSAQQMRRDMHLDGVFNLRTFDPGVDAQAREGAQRLLSETLDIDVVIIEKGDPPRNTTGPNDRTVVLQHAGGGVYTAEDVNNGDTRSFGHNTDSFFLAIGSALEPHERELFGMDGERDASGLRASVGNLLAQGQGGCFDPGSDQQMLSRISENPAVPNWMKKASSADKRAWDAAIQDYRQALQEAQSSDLPDATEYTNRDQLLAYARQKLSQQLLVQLGVDVDPDQILVTTSSTVQIADFEPPPFLHIAVNGEPRDQEMFSYEPRTRSLTELCLENVAVDDTDFWSSARFTDASGANVMALSKGEVFSLVRDLNVGQSYSQFLEQRLLKSDLGQWSRDAYARVMQAQLRVDALEARMAGDLMPDDGLPAERRDRAFKWVKAVLDHPVDDGKRPLVEKHRIQARRLELNTVCLRDVLIIAPASGQAVSALVVHTPDAPDGVRLREYASMIEMKDKLLRAPGMLDYLVTRAPAEKQSDMRRTLLSRHLPLKAATPVIKGNLFRESYENGVREGLAKVDMLTVSTSEADWQTAWNVAGTLADVIIEFTPFKAVQLPVAAGRSLYALREGLCAVRENSASSAAHFVQAGLLLADGLSGGKSKRPDAANVVKRAPSLEPRLALKKSPSGLVLRRDGIYNGVYEKVSPSGEARHYIKDAGRSYLVRYDSDTHNPGWRVINGRNPGAPYQMPVHRDTQGGWRYYNKGLSGGGPAVIDDELLTLAGKDSFLKNMTPNELIAYLGYLQSQRSVPELRKMISKLSEVGPEGLRGPYNSLHTVAMGRAQATKGGPALKRPNPGWVVAQGTAPKVTARGDLGEPLPRSPAGGNQPPEPKVSIGKPKGSATNPVDAAMIETVIPKAKWPKYLYHYTTGAHLAEYRAAPGYLRGSTVEVDGRSVGNVVGVYVTDLAPDSMKPLKLGETLFGKNPHNPGSRADKVSRYMELKTSQMDSSGAKLIRLGGPESNIYVVRSQAPDGWWQVRKTGFGKGEDILVRSGRSKDWTPPS